MRTACIMLVILLAMTLTVLSTASGHQAPVDDPGTIDGEGDVEIIVRVSGATEVVAGHLSYYMNVTYVSHRWPYVGGVAPAGATRAITALPFVRDVLPSLRYHVMLNISARSVRARNDTYGGWDTYSPKTIWDLGYRGEGMIVAILDTGVDDQYQRRLDDLDDDPDTDDPKFIGGYNARTDRTENPDDDNGHGTHMAGVVMGTPGDDGDGREIIGLAPRARLVDVKVADSSGETSSVHLLRGIEWCIDHRDHDWENDGPENDGIDVMLMSVGTDETSDGSDPVSQAVNDAVSQGIVVVAAMGNGNATVVPSPAAADLAIAVGGTDDRDTVDRDDDRLWEEDATAGTNRGPRNDDGDDDPYDELKPDVVAPSRNVWAAEGGTNYGVIETPLGNITVSGNGTTEGTGTSIGAAHVAGIVVLMLEANPALEPQGDRNPVRDILRMTAESRGTPYNRSLSGRYNTSWGYGIVDGYGAVLRALDVEKGILNVPEAVESEYNTPIVGKAMLTSTEYTGPERIDFNLTVPEGWRPVTTVAVYVDGIKVRSDLGSDGTTGLMVTATPADAGHWVISGWANVTGEEGRHWINVSVHSRAPIVGSVEVSRTFSIAYSKAYNTNVTASTGRNITVTTEWGSVSGSVVDSITGSPLQGVRVRLTYEDTSTVVNETMTDDGGRYLLVNVTEGYYDMEFWREGYLEDTNITRIHVVAGVNNTGNDVELVPVGREGILQGYIVDDTDGPLANVTVRALVSGDVVNTTRSAADGFYRMKLDAGTYDVEPVLTGYRGDTVSVEVRARTVVDLNLTMEPESEPARIHGTVRDGDGNPIQEATVSAYENGSLAGQDTTTSTGTYEIDLDPGSYTVRCTHPDFAASEVDVTLSDGEDRKMDLTLAPREDRGWIHGTVRDRTSGDPVAGASVTARSGKRTGQDITDSEGAYRIYLDEGSYTVTVTKSGYTEHVETDVEVLKGEGTLLDVELEAENRAPSILEVTFTPSTVPPDGRTLLLIEVRVTDDRPETIESVTADLSAIGGSAAQRLYDNGMFGDGAADDGTFSFETTVALGTAEDTYSITVTVTDAGGLTDTGSGTLTVASAGGNGNDNGSPGFEAPLALASLVLAALLVHRKRFI